MECKGKASVFYKCLCKSKNVAAMAFDTENRLIVSREDGVFILNKDESTIHVQKITDAAYESSKRGRYVLIQ